MFNKFKIIMLISSFYCCDVAALSSEQSAQSYWLEHPKTAKELGLMEGYPLSKQRQVTSNNFEGGGYNRWSFLHMTELFPHATIEHALKVVDFERAKPAVDINAVSFIATDGTDHDISELLYKTSTDSFLILKNGKLVNEQYFNGMKASTPHLMMSVTKTYTAMIAGILVGQGKLDTKKRVTDYLPELKNTGLTGATVQQVLDMSAALKFSEDYTDLNADIYIQDCVFYWGTPLGCKSGPDTFEAYIQMLKEKSQNNGEKFHYRTVLTNVLAMLIERTSGQRLVELLNTSLWQKLGSEHNAYISLDSAGFSYAGGGLSASGRDVARFGQMLLQQGKFNGQQIVPSNWIAETFSANSTLKKAFREGDYGEILLDWHYHNQTWVKDANQGVILAIGVHGQIIYINKSAQVVIVKQSSQPEAANMAMFLDTLAGLEAIVTELSN